MGGAMGDKPPDKTKKNLGLNAHFLYLKICPIDLNTFSKPAFEE